MSWRREPDNPDYWTGPNRPCTNCGTEFVPRGPNARFCSPPCRTASSRRRWYRLSGDAYATLLLRCGGRCEICQRRPDDTEHGTLYIDHDASLGRWAVRGLLCGRCNSSLMNPRVVPRDVAARYLANAWHLTLGPVMPEPTEFGATLYTWAGWTVTKTEPGWERSARQITRSWSSLVYEEGPHLQPRAGGAHLKAG